MLKTWIKLQNRRVANVRDNDMATTFNQLYSYIAKSALIVPAENLFVVLYEPVTLAVGGVRRIEIDEISR